MKDEKQRLKEREEGGEGARGWPSWLWIWKLSNIWRWGCGCSSTISGRV